MVKARHTRVQKWRMRRWSWVLLLAVMVMCMFLLLLLLHLHVLSVSNTNTFAPFEPHDLISISRNAYMCAFYSFTCLIQLHYFPPLVSLIVLCFSLFCRSQAEDEQGERWVEIVSWEPRAFLYHNFLVSNSLNNFYKMKFEGIF